MKFDKLTLRVILLDIVFCLICYIFSEKMPTITKIMVGAALLIFSFFVVVEFSSDRFIKIREILSQVALVFAIIGLIAYIFF